VRKRPGAVVSYKEQESDDDMSVGDDEADDVEMNGEEEAEPEEHVETIEKIMDIRQGKKGGMSLECLYFISVCLSGILMMRTAKLGKSGYYDFRTATLFQSDFHFYNFLK